MSYQLTRILVAGLVRPPVFRRTLARLPASVSLHLPLVAASPNTPQTTRSAFEHRSLSV
jgi:hypothetical protein